MSVLTKRIVVFENYTIYPQLLKVIVNKRFDVFRNSTTFLFVRFILTVTQSLNFRNHICNTWNILF